MLAIANKGITSRKYHLFLLFLMDGLFSASYGMFSYSAYVHLFDNQPLTSIVILGMIYHAMAISGGVNVVTSFIGEYLVNFKHLYIYSLVLQVFGCFLLSLNALSLIKLGLAIYTVGYGLIVTCLTIFIDDYLDQTNADKDRAKTVFTWDMLIFNVGLLVGCIIGLCVIDFGMLFAYGLVFCSLTLIVFIMSYDFINLKSKLKDKQLFRHSLLIIILVSLIGLSYISFCSTLSFISDSLLTLCFIALFVYLIYFWFKTKKEDKNKVLTFFHYLFYTTLFWTLYQTLQLLIIYLFKGRTDNLVFGYTLKLSPEWVGIINIVTIVALSLCLPWVYKRLKFSYYHSFQISLGFMLGAFIILFYAAMIATGLKLSMSLLLIYIILLSWGEVLMLPLNYTIVNQIVPDKDKPILYGVVGFNTKSFAPAACGFLIIDRVITSDPEQQITNFQWTFFIICIVLLASMLCLKFYSKNRCIKI